MKTLKWLKMTGVMAVTAMTIACGGGGGGGDSISGIGGSGISVTSVGQISGFGSIFVNGVEYETSGSSLDIDDNSGALESELKLGMVVRVTGTINADGVTGTATSVVYDEDIEGPISSAISENADMTQKTFDVFDITVIADANSTVYENTSYASLSTNDVVEVSGFYDQNGVLHATRIEGKGVLNLGVTMVEIEGTASNVMAGQFNIGAITITFDGTTDVSELPGGMVNNGQRIEVEGIVTSVSPAAISATRIEDETEDFSEDSHVELEGIISDYNSNSDFKVNGYPVNASGATFQPATLVLADGIAVEVEGTITGGVLVATEVKSEDGDILVAGLVTAVDTNQRTITIEIVPGISTLTVTVDSGTSFEDKLLGLEPFNINNISAGDYLDVRAIDNSGTILALELDRDNPDRIILQGPVQSFNGATRTLNILGVDITTDGGTQYQNVNDVPITANTFFSSIAVGTTVKMRDDDSNGIADELDIEN